jgi:hypothetical protein
MGNQENLIRVFGHNPQRFFMDQHSHQPGASTESLHHLIGLRVDADQEVIDRLIITGVSRCPIHAVTGRDQPGCQVEPDAFTGILLGICVNPAYRLVVPVCDTYPINDVSMMFFIKNKFIPVDLLPGLNGVNDKGQVFLYKIL